MKEMTQAKYFEKCLDSIRLYLMISRTLSNTNDQNLVMCSMDLLPTISETRRTLRPIKVWRCIQQEDGLEKRSSIRTLFRLLILRKITIDALRLAHVICKEAAKRAGLNYYEILKPE